MTQFEKFLLDKGYIKHVLKPIDGKLRYEVAKGHVISTMVNIDHRYFHKTDEKALQKIADGKSIMDKDFTREDRKGEICFGLHEVRKPPTLIFPRPRIEVKRIRDEEIKFKQVDYASDDNINVALKHIPHEEILKAMFDDSIALKIDLTK